MRRLHIYKKGLDFLWCIQEEDNSFLTENHGIMSEEELVQQFPRIELKNVSRKYFNITDII